MQPLLSPASRMSKLKRLGLPIPPELLEESRAYHRESKARCRKIAKVMARVGADLPDPMKRTWFLISYRVSQGIAFPL